MSVLTVSGSAALPDRSLPIDYPPTATFSARSQLPLRADSGETFTYTRAAATHSKPGVPNQHRHSRSASSAIFSPETYSSYHTLASIPASQPSPISHKPHGHSRQSSTSTFNMQRQGTTASAASAAPRRSTSSRSTSTNSPTSYVVLMRKQKATVWCDRSQNIDPRLAQAHRAAKQRANLEVAGAGNISGRTSTISSSGVVGKIRHGGVPKAPGYSPANMSGAGVPLRLSANEMLGDDEEDGQSYADNGMVHGRSGSGKSSASSAKYRSGYPRHDQGRFSGINTPPSGDVSPGKEGIPELNEAEQERSDRYQPRRDSEDSFGAVGDLAAPSALQKVVTDAKKAEDLRRRGSVDERAMSMGTGVRLYVANPDLDSD